MLMELLLFLSFYFGRNPQKTSVLPFVDNRFINDSHYKFGKMFVARIALSHAFKKLIKMLLSNWRVKVFQHRFSSRFGLWTLAPRARAALFEYMQSVRVFENITFCSLFTNHLRPFCDFNHHHTVTSNHQFLFSSEAWDAVLNSLSLLVFIYSLLVTHYSCL